MRDGFLAMSIDLEARGMGATPRARTVRSTKRAQGSKL
jgi:hypothetical protein